MNLATVEMLDDDRITAGYAILDAECIIKLNSMNSMPYDYVCLLFSVMKENDTHSVLGSLRSNCYISEQNCFEICN